MSFPVAVFDWDGTLVNSEAHIVASLAHAAKSIQLNALDHDELKSIIGLGMREAILGLYPNLDEQQIDGFRKHYAEFYFSKPSGTSDLFADTIHVLQRLKSAGICLAVATGKSRNGLDKALASTGLGEYFTVTRCADETKSKPHPLMLEEIAQDLRVSADDMVMVGDTSFDLEMANNFGASAIGVSYGVHERKRLESCRPHKIIDTLSELLALY